MGYRKKGEESDEPRLALNAGVARPATVSPIAYAPAALKTGWSVAPSVRKTQPWGRNCQFCLIW